MAIPNMRCGEDMTDKEEQDKDKNQSDKSQTATDRDRQTLPETYSNIHTRRMA